MRHQLVVIRLKNSLVVHEQNEYKNSRGSRIGKHRAKITNRKTCLGMVNKNPETIKPNRENGYARESRPGHRPFGGGIGFQRFRISRRRILIVRQRNAGQVITVGTQHEVAEYVRLYSGGGGNGGIHGVNPGWPASACVYDRSAHTHTYRPTDPRA